MLKRFLTLSMPMVLAASVQAQTPIGPFIGTDSDSFETQTAFSLDPCVIERVFSAQAEL